MLVSPSYMNGGSPTCVSFEEDTCEAASATAEKVSAEEGTEDEVRKKDDSIVSVESDSASATEEKVSARRERLGLRRQAKPADEGCKDEGGKIDDLNGSGSNPVSATEGECSTEGDSEDEGSKEMSFNFDPFSSAVLVDEVSSNEGSKDEVGKDEGDKSGNLVNSFSNFVNLDLMMGVTIPDEAPAPDSSVDTGDTSLDRESEVGSDGDESDEHDSSEAMSRPCSEAPMPSMVSAWSPLR